MSKDYYKTLGVSRDATKDDIKKAFRKLAHQYHPDKGTGDEAKFKEVNEAYQVLSNDEKRKQYDQFGSSFDQGGGFHWQDFARQAGGFNGANVNMDFGDLGDIFGEFFGRSSKRSSGGPRRGSDIEVELEVEFMDAINGATKKFELYKTVVCDHCHGNGAEPGSPIETCPTCQGTGQVQSMQRTILGNVQTIVTCSECRGARQVTKEKCKPCAG